ncbi:hypothetical protein [Streptomyces sp. NPDC086787]|uniref:hypothetical protein n=1 Tax=Streptomyces sp. NPDC086787 TaxID=3365759 RepID=UPI0037F1B497
MPDRSPRLLTFPPFSAQGEERGTVLLRERPSSPPDAPSGRESGQGDGQGGAPQDDNPFAPPPEGTPDSPWQPRRPSGSGSGSGSGSQWSDQQPGRSPDGFGERPRGGPEGPGGPGTGPGMRWDPTDPVQRRARYALLSGIWGFFFAIFGWPYVALLLGALALYWGGSALRGRPRTAAGQDSRTQDRSGRPQTTAAISGLVTGGVALALVGATFTAQLVYRDYYTCVDDALTSQAEHSCDQLLPKELRTVLGNDS